MICFKIFVSFKFLVLSFLDIINNLHDCQPAQIIFREINIKLSLLNCSAKPAGIEHGNNVTHYVEKNIKTALSICIG